MDELDPRLGGVSFFRPDRAYYEADSITPRRRDRYRRLRRISCRHGKRRDNARARTASGNNCLDIKAAAAG
jgi:hypothetical protein